MTKSFTQKAIAVGLASAATIPGIAGCGSQSEAHRVASSVLRGISSETTSSEHTEAAQGARSGSASDVSPGWTGSEGETARNSLLQRFMAGRPATSSVAQWRAVGECTLRKLETQFTAADFLRGDSHIPTTELQDGIMCGASGG